MFTALIQAAMLAAALPAHHAAPATHVTVHPGDTLSSIASQQCGKVNDWTGIYAHSRAIVGPNPNVILPGQRLKVVCKDPKNLLKLAAAPVAHHTHTAATHHASGGDRWDGQHHACGDGDGDGFDMPCSQLGGGGGSSVTEAHTAAAPAAPAQSSYSGAPGSFQSCVIARESGGNPQAVNPSSGAGGLYQFLPSTWAALGFSGLPENASVATQNAAFAKAYAQSGTSPWGPYDGC